MDLKQKNELAKSLVQKEIKPSPLELNPLFDNKENYRKFLETGHNDFDQNKNFDKKKEKEELKKDDIEDIYMRKKRLAEVRDIIIKKKKEERENFMKTYQKVIFSQNFQIKII